MGAGEWVSTEIDDVAQLVHDAPDLESRAAILGVEVPMLARARRRFISATWTFGILLGLFLALLPTYRFLSQVHAHGIAVSWQAAASELVLGAAATLALFMVSRTLLSVAKIVLVRTLPGRHTVELVVWDLLASILVPGIATLSWILFAPQPLFVYGAIAAGSLAALPRPRDYDFVGALRANKPRIGAAIARQQRGGGPLTLVNGRSRWLALQVMSNSLITPAALLLVLAHPWALVAVIAANFATRSACLALEIRQRYRTALAVHVGTAILMAVAAVVFAGSALWSTVQWIAPAVPA